MKERSRQKAVPYTETNATAWLGWLAHGMRRHGQTVFQIEQLQPRWLLSSNERLIFLLATRMTWGMLAGLIVGAILGLVLVLGVGLMGGMIAGLVGGCIFGLIDYRRFRPPFQATTWEGRSRKQHLLTGIALSVLVFLGLCWAIGWLLGSLFGELGQGGIGGLIGALSEGQVSAPIGGLIGGTGAGLIFGLIYGSIWTSRSTFRQLTHAIQPVETVRWSWPNCRRRGLLGILVGLISGLCIGFLIGPVPVMLGEPPELLIFLPIGGLIGAILGGLIGALTGGFRPGIRELKSVPNQGIRLSILHAVQVGTPLGLVVGLLIGIIGKSPGSAVAYALIVTVGFGMWYGGLETTDHAILRLLLYFRGYAPLNYARFLDYAAGPLNFLQKVGGGYVFIHRYLLEYFAAMVTSGEADSAKTQTEAVATEASIS